MYLETLENARPAVPTPLHARRSLSGEFVFVSQDRSVAFTAEACIEVLRSANRLTGQQGYGWTHLVGEDALAEADPSVCGPEQTLVLIGGTEDAWRPGEGHLRALRTAIRNAARVCVVGSAVFVPLAAGVLSTKRMAVHPNYRASVEETDRGIEMHDGATCHHKALSSAVGPAAAMRMMVELVGARDGEFTRMALARYLGLAEPGDEGGANEHWRYQRMAQGDEVISDALQIMRDHLEDTLSVGQIADILDVSPRKLERGFNELLGQTPLKVYRDLRLERAHKLLAQTAMPVGEVSVACGFSNVTLMKKWFFRKYDQMPGDVRRHAFAGSHAA